MRFSNLIRYALWIGLAETANANRREYRMLTPWVPHLVENTFFLFLPEIYRVLPEPTQAHPAESTFEKSYRAFHDVIRAAAHDNPEYAACVAPTAIGYILSNPKFNIYKGDMAKIRIAGFRLDGYAHGASAFTLTRLIFNTAHLSAHKLSPGNPIAPFLRWMDKHAVTVTAAALVGASALWELGEYFVHEYELAVKDHDVEKINMMWDVKDMLRDTAANSVGWALAVLLESQKPLKVDGIDQASNIALISAAQDDQEGYQPDGQREKRQR